ncbi:heavy metal translocating P-type ATPase [Gemmatimonas aurantiaca]|uniref:heavy metal translocating P-type ATPase n=1 Tax=Gemmatimonas aurantiaca TaxID=173480 RepID=UPI001E2CE22F|nr:heavy metal translocating P-type ATPase [Gemmatimonas aurantiaca]
MTVLEGQPGVAQAHVLDVGDLEPGGAAPVTRPVLCLHYDPDQITLSEVEGMARGAGASISAQYAHRLLPIRLVATEDDGTRLESELRAVPGVTAASVNLAAQVARVEYDRTVATDEQIDAAVRAASAAPKQAEDAVAASQGWYARNRELAWSLMSGALLLAGWLLERNAFEPRWIPITTYVLSYVFGARDNVGHFLGDLRRGKFHFNIDLLMVVAAAGAAVLGEWAEGALLLVLFSLGHALEHYALGRARSAITALAELAPSRATVLRAENGVQREVVVGIDLVRPGDVVIVKPAERVPVDGTVREGRSGVNQAPITGESVPVDKAPGDPMFAGSVNGEGALLIDVTVAIGDRTLDRVIKLVSEAQTQKAPTQQFTERFARVFVPLVLIGDVLLIVVPPLLGLLSWSESFARAMAVLVAASPCALALGTPAAVLAGIAQAARNGVLIKGGAHLEALGSIRSLAFDKTGTITVGEPSVTDIVPMTGVADVMVLINAASVEQRSQHPLAKAVVRRAVEQKLAVPEAGELQSITARGVRAPVDGAVVEIGRALLFEDAGVVVPQDVRDAVTRLENAGRSTMIVRRVGHTPEFLGVLGLADEPRANARATLVALRGAGIQRIIMLTGDNAGVGNEVGTAVGVDEVRAGLLPEDKVSSIKELAARGPVAMVGDGVNDAPALAHATVGIAMGGAGTAAALETADVALMGDDLSRLPFAIALSRQAKRVIRQNLFVSLGVIVALVAVTVSGMASIGPAVIAHEGSTLVVIANALRLLRFRAKG